MSENVNHCAVERSWSEKLYRLGLGLFCFVVLVSYVGVLIAMLWGWFVVPLGVQPITPSWAIGLVCLVSMFTGTSGRKRSSPDFNEFLWEILFMASFATLVFLVGAAARLVM